MLHVFISQIMKSHSFRKVFCILRMIPRGYDRVKEKLPNAINARGGVWAGGEGPRLPD